MTSPLKRRTAPKPAAVRAAVNDQSEVPEHLRELAEYLPLLVTVPRTIEATGISRKTLWRAISRGDLRVIRDGVARQAHVRIPRAELIRYLAERST